MKECIIIYLILINITSIALTISDKVRAINNKWRIPEKTLLLVGLLGGATGEFITMNIIRHKTKHLKFMLLLPLEIFLHISILIIIYKVAL